MHAAFRPATLRFVIWTHDITFTKVSFTWYSDTDVTTFSVQCHGGQLTHVRMIIGGGGGQEGGGY